MVHWLLCEQDVKKSDRKKEISDVSDPDFA